MPRPPTAGWRFFFMLNGILQFFAEFWEIILLAATWLGIFLVAMRRRSDWAHKRFIQQVNFSLNYVVDGTLMLRTLAEESARRVWLNDHGVQQVLKAARSTTPGQPFLRLHSARDMDYVKRAVLNVLSERFSEAFLARSMELEVRTDRYVFGITYERYGSIRTQKLRVIIMRKAELEAVFGAGDPDELGVVSSQHKDRITTLRRMYQISRSRRKSIRRMLGEVELGVVVPAKAPAGEAAPRAARDILIEPRSTPLELPDDSEPEPEEDEARADDRTRSAERSSTSSV